MNGRIVLLNLISSFLVLSLVTAASAQTRTVGVNVGNKFRYSTIAHWNSDDPNATILSNLVEYNNTEWFELKITATSGTNISGQDTTLYKNLTEYTADGRIDIATGIGNFLLYFISANLTAGDSIYGSPYYSNTLINETVPRTYLGGVRDTNHLNLTANMNQSLYWDKSTGVLIDYLIENTYQTGPYTTSWSQEFQIISSDLWVVPEFSMWTFALLMFIVLTTAMIISRQRARVK